MINYSHQETQAFRVPDSFSPLQLSICLRRLGISQNLRRKIKYHGSVEINGTISPWNTLVYPNSIIQVSWNMPGTIMPEDIFVPIIFEDDWLLIVDKPAGMLVHPTTKQPGGTLANAIIHHYRKHGLSHAFHPIQRLDKDTSGLLAIAKLSSVHHAMNKQYLQRQYLAFASGIPAVEKGSISLPIARANDSIILRTVSELGQHALTRFCVLQSFDNACLLQLELDTGRTHQIRVHLAAIGHPLLGDDLYGGSTALIPRQALHSCTLELKHPINGSHLIFTSPLPKDLVELQSCLSGHASISPAGEL